MAEASSWKFRPSALTSAANVYTSGSSREALVDYYEADNRRAVDEGVVILKRHESSKLRTLQWNINGGSYRCSRKISRGVSENLTGVIDTVRDADADVVVLNEYRKRPSLDDGLRALGYYNLHHATVSFPTALATRLEVMESREIVLSFDRSALLARVRTDDGDSTWVIGTHLNFCWGKQRMKEMQVLLDELDDMGITVGGDADAITDASRERAVLVGDLNQQRERDYAPGEWGRIRSGMEFRRSTPDDGVAGMLAGRGFACAWDASPPLRTNWETSHAPATHWSGTAVDYSYGRNASPLAVSISSAGWSDHRMTVCDWTWR